MRRPAPAQRGCRPYLAALPLLLLIGPLAVASGGELPPTAQAPAVLPAGRQVTVFGIIASTSRTTIDPKLDPIASQLRKLEPGHGFRLRAVTSERLAAGGHLKTALGDGLEARVSLVELDAPGGKLRLGFDLVRQGQVEYRTTVVTPPNQLFFCEKPLPGGDRLLIGVGAR
jgi:hypothetical protein